MRGNFGLGFWEGLGLLGGGGLWGWSEERSEERSEEDWGSESHAAAIFPVDLALKLRAKGAPCPLSASIWITSPSGDSTLSSGGGEELERLEERREDLGDSGGGEDDSERLLLTATRTRSAALFLFPGVGELVKTPASVAMALASISEADLLED